MIIVIMIIASIILLGAQQNGGELYMHDPGPAEYMVGMLYLAAIVMGIIGLFKKL